MREYQSEIAALRGQALSARRRASTIQVLFAAAAGAGLLFMYVSHIDRVVSSSPARSSPPDPPIVYQALDPSVIRSLDVKGRPAGRQGAVAGDAGPDFRLRARSISCGLRSTGYRAQIARDQALIALAPLNYPTPTNDQIARFQKREPRILPPANGAVPRQHEQLRPEDRHAARRPSRSTRSTKRATQGSRGERRKSKKCASRWSSTASARC